MSPNSSSSFVLVRSLTTITGSSHFSLLGCTVPSNLPLAESLAKHVEAGRSSEEVEEFEERWLDGHNLLTYEQGGCSSSPLPVGRRNDPRRFSPAFKAKTTFNLSLPSDGTTQSISELRPLAKTHLNGEDLFWDCDASRTSEGYYRTTGGIRVSLQRVVFFYFDTFLTRPF